MTKFIEIFLIFLAIFSKKKTFARTKAYYTWHFDKCARKNRNEALKREKCNRKRQASNKGSHKRKKRKNGSAILSWIFKISYEANSEEILVKFCRSSARRNRRIYFYIVPFCLTPVWVLTSKTRSAFLFVLLFCSYLRRVRRKTAKIHKIYRY